MYWFELSTHNGVVGFYTSKANGEPFAYTLQLNTKEGYLTIKDDADNFIHLNSAEQRIEFGNSAKSLFDMVGENITIESVNSISQNTKNYSLQCTNYNVTASTATHTGATFNINSVTTISKALTAAANFSASAGTACSLPGGTTVGGELLVQSARASGNIYASNFIET
jgi:hypothetical protein